ncbi:MAG TPA: hypothetical protein P5573_07965, partial [Syntrophales bacterium]|nr:hypothetical protein [Syntrophales bacterium]
MVSRSIYITESDKMRLEEIIAVASEFSSHTRKDLEALAQELARAEIVDPKEVRPDVVTMNSRVILQDIDTDEEMNYAL